MTESSVRGPQQKQCAGVHSKNGAQHSERQKMMCNFARIKCQKGMVFL